MKLMEIFEIELDETQIELCYKQFKIKCAVSEQRLAAAWHF